MVKPLSIGAIVILTIFLVYIFISDTKQARPAVEKKSYEEKSIISPEIKDNEKNKKIKSVQSSVFTKKKQIIHLEKQHSASKWLDQVHLNINTAGNRYNFKIKSDTWIETGTGNKILMFVEIDKISEFHVKIDSNLIENFSSIWIEVTDLDINKTKRFDGYHFEPLNQFHSYLAIINLEPKNISILIKSELPITKDLQSYTGTGETIQMDKVPELLYENSMSDDKNTTNSVLRLQGKPRYPDKLKNISNY